MKYYKGDKERKSLKKLLPKYVLTHVKSGGGWVNFFFVGLVHTYLDIITFSSWKCRHHNV